MNETVSLSLISHTNVGKTTLARTLLRRDVGEVRDAAHRARPAGAVRVVVDESPYAARLAGDVSLAPRLEERRRLWREFVAGYGLEADLASLETTPEQHSR